MKDWFVLILSAVLTDVAAFVAGLLGNIGSLHHAFHVAAAVGSIELFGLAFILFWQIDWKAR